MNHVSTVCTHCADGCKVTLGVRQANDGSEIVRADNRDKSGINGDFLCAKGRFGFDFVESPERLTKPLVRNAAGQAGARHLGARAPLRRRQAQRNSRHARRRGHRRHRLQPDHQRRELPAAEIRAHGSPHQQHRPRAHHRLRSLCPRPRRPPRQNRQPARHRLAPAILLIGGNPTEEHPLLAWMLRTNVRLNRARLYIANSKPIKLERQAKAVQRPAAQRLQGSRPPFLDRRRNRFQQSHPGRRIARRHLRRRSFAARPSRISSPGASSAATSRFAYLGDHSNSRGAADMGLFPDLLPGYVPVTAPGAFAEYPNLPATPGKIAAANVRCRCRKANSARCSSSAPILLPRLKLDPAALKNTFVVVQDLFLTETAALADVVFPAASLYEKSGTVTNTFGDVQLVSKAADRAGVKPDFEILVRLAGAMGADVKTLVPFGKGGTTADLGQSRGAQSGEADRHAVWLAANGLEPKLSPFDPLAVLDEIERLVPGYTLDRLNLFGGNDVHTEPGFVAGFVPAAALAAPDLIVPAHDTLFTSGTLGRYSPALKQLKQHQSKGTRRIRSRLAVPQTRADLAEMRRRLLTADFDCSTKG